MTAAPANVRTVARPANNRSSITNRKRLLPDVHSQSKWARLMADVLERVHMHLGGEDYLTEPQRLQARRVAVLETEMIYIESSLAMQRNAGETPSDREVDLYSRLASAQRRILEALGMQRVARDVTPDPLTYAAQREAADAEVENA